RGEYIVKDFLPALKQEHAFWMDGSDRSGPDKDYRRVVQLEDGVVLNRYWDDRPLPREESWREDVELAESMDTENTREVYLHIRAAAESGWDFTSRWLQDQRSMGTIHTTDIIPADLNALLYALEKKLGEWSSGSDGKAFTRAAETRKSIYDRYFWNGREGFYFDYDWKQEEQTPVWSLAAVYPLFVGLASEEQAKSVADHLENKFLEEGGLVSSLHETGQQWDHPNGWAPLQWMAVSGLRDYGHDSLAEEIAQRWLKLNRAVYDRTGKMMEKYNVTDLFLEGGGGEYPLQDGFGWTNGVAVALQDLYG
ncbi:MAG: trehalase family glycosidase, partial [Balneolaceae bacterium]|nr:trehalase family glycosidase [Balneolaceae bacterium]